MEEAPRGVSEIRIIKLQAVAKRETDRALVAPIRKRVYSVCLQK